MRIMITWISSTTLYHDGVELKLPEGSIIHSKELGREERCRDFIIAEEAVALFKLKNPIQKGKKK